ncbi:MAG: sn-glycerol-3-phosphate ABC transporter ATP-binding protein UgpC [Erysipelotrichaceae bacterium]|nr:sn-glycerol-3-phosphate ABC transporter ATP-binding protein UgpC [Erysipelotrichaceae bacterium]
MASVSLKHIQKIYPNAEPQKKSKKKKKEEAPVEEKKYKLKVTDEGVIAVDDFNLDIADKEFIVFVGPSGCGKSTTLRMVAGLEEITRGDLYIDGVRVNDVAPKDRDIAMVFQNYALYPHMTVRQNLEFPLKLRKVPKDQIDQRVNEAAEILGITQYLERKPKALSGGQRQRVAIGRAIVREPKVLLMDEPLSNLDAKLRNQMRAEIIKLRHRINTTFIYVTHDQTEAMTLGDRIVIMRDGEVQQIGTPQEVFNNPINTFVAGFIGMPQMNMFNGKLIKRNGKYCVQVQDAVIELSADKQKHLADRNVPELDVTVGARPEHITLDQVDGAMLDGVVEVSEMMGSSVHLHLNTNGRDCIIIVPTLDLKDNAALEIGANVKFTFAPSAIHVFDPWTGKNLEYITSMEGIGGN